MYIWTILVSVSIPLIHIYSCTNIFHCINKMWKFKKRISRNSKSIRWFIIISMSANNLTLFYSNTLWPANLSISDSLHNYILSPWPMHYRAIIGLYSTLCINSIVLKTVLLLIIHGRDHECLERLIPLNRRKYSHSKTC